ncbi:MAG: hypothetical protein U0Z44_08875 [Kouleothrix sp.]
MSWRAGARSPAELARIALPPPATTSSPLPLLAGTLGLAAAIYLWPAPRAANLRLRRRAQGRLTLVIVFCPCAQVLGHIACGVARALHRTLHRGHIILRGPVAGQELATGRRWIGR